MDNLSAVDAPTAPWTRALEYHFIVFSLMPWMTVILWGLFALHIYSILGRWPVPRIEPSFDYNHDLGSIAVILWMLTLMSVPAWGFLLWAQWEHHRARMKGPVLVYAGGWITLLVMDHIDSERLHLWSWLLD